MTQPDNLVIAGAVGAAKVYPLPPSVTIAQFADETGWGAHMPHGSNNPFGMKAKPGQPFVVAPTWEVYHGHKVIINAAFRTFPTLQDAFVAHNKLLMTAPVYATARLCLPDAIKFCHALTGVYATDPLYGSKLEAIIRGSNLLRFDVA